MIELKFIGSISLFSSTVSSLDLPRLSGFILRSYLCLWCHRFYIMESILGNMPLRPGDTGTCFYRGWVFIQIHGGYLILKTLLWMNGQRQEVTPICLKIQRPLKNGSKSSILKCSENIQRYL